MMSNKLKIKHLKSKFIITLFLLLLCSFNIFSQTLIYSDILQGGITGNGGTAAFGSGTINMPVQIPPNSTIKKAYLIAARDSLADDFTVTLNGVAYTFTNASIVTNGFLAYSELAKVSLEFGANKLLVYKILVSNLLKFFIKYKLLWMK